jgi:hypothetical protein
MTAYLDFLPLPDCVQGIFDDDVSKGSPMKAVSIGQTELQFILPLLLASRLTNCGNKTESKNAGVEA